MIDMCVCVCASIGDKIPEAFDGLHSVEEKKLKPFHFVIITLQNGGKNNGSNNT